MCQRLLTNECKPNSLWSCFLEVPCIPPVIARQALYWTSACSSLQHVVNFTFSLDSLFFMHLFVTFKCIFCSVICTLPAKSLISDISMSNSSLSTSPAGQLLVTCFIKKWTLNNVPLSETPWKKTVIISLTCEEWKQD